MVNKFFTGTTKFFVVMLSQDGSRTTPEFELKYLAYCNASSYIYLIINFNFIAKLK